MFLLFIAIAAILVIYTNLAERFQKRRCLKSVDDDNNDGAWVYYKLTCESSAQVR